MTEPRSVNLGHQSADGAQSTTKPVWPFVVLAVLSPVAGYVGADVLNLVGRYVLQINFGVLRSFFVASLVLITLALLVIGIVLAVKRSNTNAKLRAPRGPVPTGYTTDGQPIYRVVGYTPDGQPVTADRAVGVHPPVTGTNAMAIVALVTGLIFAPLGIVFGHIALSQIKHTGEAGRGLAIVGLALGYVSVAAMIVMFLAVN